MKNKAVSGMMLTLLLISVLTSAFIIQPVKSEWTWTETIYIRADGSVEPDTAPISSVDNVTYTLEDNIIADVPERSNAIVVERDNIVVDGAGYTVQGTLDWLGYEGRGIFLSGRSNVTIKNMEIKTFRYGIWLEDYSNDNSISGNNIIDHGYGIYVYNSSNNSIIGNTFVYCGLFVVESYGNRVENNLVNSKPLIYLEGVSDYTVENAGQVILVNCSRILVENLDFSNTRSVGVELWRTNNTRIAGNNIGNGSAIYLGYSNYNSIAGNNGIFTLGIMLSYSLNNSISANNITHSGWGIVLYRNSNFNSVSGNKITNGGQGILIVYSSNNSISRNNITKNSDSGIWLMRSDSNSLFGNNIANNEIGIDLWDSRNNEVYHNNFIGNFWQHALVRGFDCTNIWDDGYPSGGNYWSGYTSIDDYSGPNQNQPGSDGIWDHPYVIDFLDPFNKDNYPLVEPWSPVISATLDVDPDTLNLKSKGQWITGYIELPEGYNVSDIDVSTVMLNDTIPISLLDVPSQEPVPTEIGDYDEDGIPDLMVKFDRPSVQSFVYNQGITYGEVSLTITGELSDGTPFEGTDVISVNYAGDANNDGMIDIFDIGTLSAHWYPGPPTGTLSYDSSCDFNKDEAVDIFDIGILSVNWGQTTP